MSSNTGSFEARRRCANRIGQLVLQTLAALSRCPRLTAKSQGDQRAATRTPSSRNCQNDARRLHRPHTSSTVCAGNIMPAARPGGSSLLKWAGGGRPVGRGRRRAWANMRARAWAHALMRTCKHGTRKQGADRRSCARAPGPRKGCARAVLYGPVCARGATGRKHTASNARAAQGRHACGAQAARGSEVRMSCCGGGRAPWAGSSGRWWGGSVCVVCGLRVCGCGVWAQRPAASGTPRAPPTPGPWARRRRPHGDPRRRPRRRSSRRCHRPWPRHCHWRGPRRRCGERLSPRRRAPRSAAPQRGRWGRPGR